MTQAFFNKKIPTLLGIVLIVLGLGITTLLTNNATFLQTNAQINKQPLEVRITNLTDKSFTISYVTSDEVSGYINYGTDNTLGKTAFDENDELKKLQNHLIHSITLRDLNPSTKYYFSIISGGDTYLNNNTNFVVTTTSLIPNSTSDTQVMGKVILFNSNPASSAIIYLTVDNSQVLSSLTKNDGSFSINLQKLLTSDLSEPQSLMQSSIVRILVLGNSQKSNVTLYYSQIKNIPIITLSNNYDFRFNQNPTASPSASFDGFSSQINTKIKSKTVQILTPINNQSFSNSKPIISGQAAPNQSVQITIHSQQIIKDVVKTDSSGNWTYQPTTSLDPGTHTITISAKDSNGILKTVTQTFTISPTQNVSSPTPSPKLISSTALNNSISKQQILPSNNTFSIVTAGIVGLLIAGVGGFIFLLSRKGI